MTREAVRHTLPTLLNNNNKITFSGIFRNVISALLLSHTFWCYCTQDIFVVQHNILVEAIQTRQWSNNNKDKPTQHPRTEIDEFGRVSDSKCKETWITRSEIPSTQQLSVVLRPTRVAHARRSCNESSQVWCWRRSVFFTERQNPGHGSVPWNLCYGSACAPRTQWSTLRAINNWLRQVSDSSRSPCILGEDGRSDKTSRKQQNFPLFKYSYLQGWFTNLQFLLMKSQHCTFFTMLTRSDQLQKLTAL